MKRVQPQIIYPRDGSGPVISYPEKWDGEYVLASEAMAEIERLRGLVREAFVEGYERGSDGWVGKRYADILWESSDTIKSITPPTPTPNP